MLFSVITTISPEKLAERTAAIPAHRAYLASHTASILAVGTTFAEGGDLVGSTYLVDVDDWKAARAFIADDSMTVSGARQSIDILEGRMGGLDRRYPWTWANGERQDAERARRSDGKGKSAEGGVDQGGRRNLKTTN